MLDPAQAAAPEVRSGRLRGLSLLQLTPTSDDDAPFVSVSRVSELLEQETLAGQYVVIEAPALVQSAAAQAVCHAADQTLLVIDTKATRVPPAREAVALLRQIGARARGGRRGLGVEGAGSGAPEVPPTTSQGPEDQRPPNDHRTAQVDAGQARPSSPGQRHPVGGHDEECPAGRGMSGVASKGRPR